ncbi:MAG: DNA repair protein RadC [Lachnospiraceae bacterium]|jgi:DNA repair protein RadC|nr:DNA repair protein RadC [Lachnospiraceae bacterium]
MKHYLTVKDLPEDERPYEKCERLGASRLSDAELLAVILRTGVRGQRSTDLACQILNLLKKEEGILGLHHLAFHDLIKIHGIGKVKAVQLLCIAELSIRMARAVKKTGTPMNSPEHVASYYMESMRNLEYEQAVVVMLDGKNRFAGDFLLSKGTVKASLVSPREMFREAMKAGAVYVILLHNHPSGDPTPSSQDISTTKRVKTTGEILDIPLLDHIIIGDHKYVSLKEMGLF